MLDSVFIAVFIVTVVIQLVGVYEKSIVFNMISMMFWLTLMLNSLWIEVPYWAWIENATGGINVSTGSHVYHEFGLSALFLTFIFMDIILIIVYYMDWKRKSEIP